MLKLGNLGWLKRIFPKASLQISSMLLHLLSISQENIKKSLVVKDFCTVFQNAIECHCTLVIKKASLCIFIYLHAYSLLQWSIVMRHYNRHWYTRECTHWKVLSIAGRLHTATSRAEGCPPRPDFVIGNVKRHHPFWTVLNVNVCIRISSLLLRAHKCTPMGTTNPSLIPGHGQNKDQTVFKHHKPSVWAIVPARFPLQ